VPVVLTNIPDSLIVTGPVPEYVEITIACSKLRKTLTRFKQFKLALNLAEFGPGRQRIALTPRQVRLPDGIDHRDVSDIKPIAIDIRLEELLNRRVQVTLASSGTISENLVLLDGALSITPSWVYIKGPASAVQHIRSVTTETLDLGKIRDSFERELPLVFDRARFECDPDRVTVTVKVSERGQRVLANVPPTVLIDSEDYSASVTPRNVTLTLTGPRAVLDTLKSGDVSVLLNLGGLAEARYRMAPEIILPPAVELTAMSVDSLTVEIVKNAEPNSP
jgi:YbbR domain-containing protein